MELLTACKPCSTCSWLNGQSDKSIKLNSEFTHIIWSYNMQLCTTYATLSSIIQRSNLLSGQTYNDCMSTSSMSWLQRKGHIFSIRCYHDVCCDAQWGQMTDGQQYIALLTLNNRPVCSSPLIQIYMTMSVAMKSGGFILSKQWSRMSLLATTLFLMFAARAPIVATWVDRFSWCCWR